MAIGTGAAIGIGAIGAGSMGAGAYFQNRAAKAQAKNAREAADLYRQGLDTAAGKLDPYLDVGNKALGIYSGLTLGEKFNPETGEFTPLSAEERLKLFQESPDYQFRLEQGQKALEASQAAQGGLLGGRALKEFAKYNQGMASTEFGSYLDRILNLSGMGQNAATNQGVILSGGQNALAGLNLAGGSYNAQKNSNYANMASQIGGGIFQGLGAAAGTGAIGGPATNAGTASSGSGAGIGAGNTQLRSPALNFTPSNW